MLVLVRSLKWLHANAGIKYSRWEKHLEMLVERSGCVVIRSAVLRLDGRRVSELKLFTWNTPGLCRASFLKGKIGPRGHGPTFSSSETRNNEGDNVFPCSFYFKAKATFRFSKPSLKLLTHLTEKRHKIQFYNCFMQIGY